MQAAQLNMSGVRVNAWYAAVPVVHKYVAQVKERCNCAYIGIAVSHFADRNLEAVPTRAMASSFLNEASHSVRLLWTSDQLVAETST